MAKASMLQGPGKVVYSHKCAVHMQTRKAHSSPAPYGCLAGTVTACPPSTAGPHHSVRPSQLHEMLQVGAMQDNSFEVRDAGLCAHGLRSHWVTLFLSTSLMRFSVGELKR